MKQVFKLKNNRTGSVGTGVIKRIQLEDFEAVRRLESVNLNHEKDKTMCMVIDDYETERSLKLNTGVSFGCYIDDELIGYNTFCQSFDDDVETNCMGLDEDDFEQNAVFWSVAHVHFDYRGNGLQQKIAEVCFEEMQHIRPNIKHVFAVVHPLNYPSVISMLNEGFILVGIINIRDVYFRYETYRNLERPFKSSKQMIEKVLADDFETQRRLFKEGYYVVAYEHDNKGNLVFCMDKGSFD